MGFKTGGAARGASAGSAFGPWGALAGGVLGGFMGGDSSTPPTPPTMANPLRPGAVTGQYGQSYIDPVTGQITYAGTSGNRSGTSLLNSNLQSQLMGYGGTGNDIANQIAQQRAKIASISGAGNNFGFGGQAGNTDPSQPYNFSSAIGNMMMNDVSGPGSSAQQAYRANQNNQLAQYAGNKTAQQAQLADAQAYLATLENAQKQASGPNQMLDYLNHGPDQANTLQQQVMTQYQNAQKANQLAMAKRGMGTSTMNELTEGQNMRDLGLGISGAQIAAGQSNFNNRKAMLDYLSGQNAQDLSAEGMRGGLYNQQMAQGQGLGMQMSNNQSAADAANAGLQWQGQNAQYQAGQANQANINNNIGSLGSGLGQYQSNQAMQQWLNNQRNMGGSTNLTGRGDGL